jgi:hypothetical protein
MNSCIWLRNQPELLSQRISSPVGRPAIASLAPKAIEQE